MIMRVEATPMVIHNFFNDRAPIDVPGDSVKMEMVPRMWKQCWVQRLIESFRPNNIAKA